MKRTIIIRKPNEVEVRCANCKKPIEKFAWLQTTTEEYFCEPCAGEIFALPPVPAVDDLLEIDSLIEKKE